GARGGGRRALADDRPARDGPRTLSGTDGGGDGLGGLAGSLRLGHWRRIPAGVAGVSSRVVILVGRGVDEVGAGVDWPGAASRLSRLSRHRRAQAEDRYREAGRKSDQAELLVVHRATVPRLKTLRCKQRAAAGPTMVCQRLARRT